MNDAPSPYVGFQPYIDFTSSANFALQRIGWTLNAGLDGYMGTPIDVLDDKLEGTFWIFNDPATRLNGGSVPLSARIIAGRITEGGVVGLGGVTVTLGGGTTATLTTDADGTYSFPNLTDGSYTVTASRDGYMIVPVQLSVVLADGSATEQNFVAIKAQSPSGGSGQPVVATQSIAGRIAESGSGVSGVTVTLNGPTPGVVTTDAGGNYLVPGLANGFYTVTPSKDGYTFSPVDLTVLVSGQSASGQDFAAIKTTQPSGGGEAPVTTPPPGGMPMEFVWIAPGNFQMGSPDSEPGRDSDEGPQHPVTIAQGFYLGKHEITQGQWQAVMETTPWVGRTIWWSIRTIRRSTCRDDAQEFIHKLNTAAGDSLYRLPTEAEWEYACRAGTTTTWSFGNNAGQLKDYA